MTEDAPASRWTVEGPRPGRENMDEDGALLRRALSLGPQDWVGRIYEWDVPTVSLGLSQDPSEIDRDRLAAAGGAWVTRATGGKAVLHHDEITYAVAAPVPSAVFGKDLLGAYLVVAEGLLDFFAALGINAELTRERPGSAAGPVCFASPGLYEITFRGSKIAGSAQKRIAGAFLQHGSVPVRVRPARVRDYLVRAEASVPGSEELCLADLVHPLPSMAELKALLRDRLDARFLQTP